MTHTTTPPTSTGLGGICMTSTFLNRMASGWAPDVPAPSLPSNLSVKLEMASKGETADVAYAEIHRICRMPVIRPMDDQEFDDFNRRHLLVSAYDSGFRLFRAQAEGLRSYQTMYEIYGHGGGCHPIGVGFGKTLLSLLIASWAQHAKGFKRMVYFCPSHLVPQLMETQVPLARKRIPINYPFHVLAGKSRQARMGLAASLKAGLYVFPYSLLSQQDAREVLAAINPELIIADEAHRLANAVAARTKRIRDFWDLKHNKCDLVALSGTITKKSVGDYFHIAHRALRDGNFLPNTTSIAMDWGSVIDSDGGSTSSAPLLPLIQWAKQHFPDDLSNLTEDQHGFRRAFRHRLETTPGVVSTGDASIPTSLTVRTLPVKNHDKHPDWQRLQELMDKVEQAWLTPNDDPIDHAIHKFKWVYELTAGFYNELRWPTVDALATRKKCSPEEAESILQRSMFHLQAKRLYDSILRKWIESEARHGLDTPLLIASNMSRNGSKDVGSELFSAWEQTRKLDFPGRIDRDGIAVRVSNYKIVAAMMWAFGIANSGGIVWVFHKEMGEWTYQMFQEAGLDPLYCPAGEKGDSEVADPKNAKRIVIASMPAHGEGKNLQHFQHQFFLQWPRMAAMAEQTIGRLHRSGQEADELYVDVPTTTEFDKMNFFACVQDALYTHQTTGNRQKLIYCNYDPMPVVFPAAVLRERGFSPSILNEDQKQLLKERFGS